MYFQTCHLSLFPLNGTCIYHSLHFACICLAVLKLVIAFLSSQHPQSFFHCIYQQTPLVFFLHFFLSPHSTVKAMHVGTVFSHTIQPALGRVSATYPLFIICLLSPLTRPSRNFYVEEVRIFSLEQRKLNRKMIQTFKYFRCNYLKNQIYFM